MGELCFFESEIDWLGFKISGEGVRPLVGKADSLKNLPISKKILELQSFFSSIHQYKKFFPNSLTLNSPIRPLLNKKSVYKWDNVHSAAFEKLKTEIVNITENSHFDIKKKSRLKSDASHSGLGATSEKFLRGPVENYCFRLKILK